MKKLLLLLITVLILSLSACTKPKEDVYVFFTSDVHCGIDENLGFGAVKALVDETKAEGKNVVLVDAGDFLQGGTIGSMSQGQDIIDIMNKMNYDVVTFGNHEFDYGMDRLAELMEQADFQMAACNVRYTGNQRNIFEHVPAYVMKDFNGTKVAFLGILTPDSLTTSTPAFFMEDGRFVYDFYSGNDGNDLAVKVQETVDEARKQGADYVVAISHLGSSAAVAPHDSVSLISKTTGIDAVIDGHSHSIISGDLYPNANGEDVLLASVGTKMQNLGELIIAADGSISCVLISEYDKTDEEIDAAIASVNEKLDQVLAQKIGELDFTLRISDENGIRQVRSRETNLGDFVADAFRDHLQTDVVVFNGGSIRKNIEAGDVTYGDFLNVTPFGNTAASCYATGQQILDVLEFCSRSTESINYFEDGPVGESGAFLQVSGLSYTIDTSIPSGVLTDEDGMYMGIEGERRIRDVMILENGKYVPIDPEKIYTVGGTDYVLFQRGDGNSVFYNNERIIANGALDVDVLIAYFNSLESFEEYREPQGRITIR